MDPERKRWGGGICSKSLSIPEIKILQQIIFIRCEKQVMKCNYIQLLLVMSKKEKLIGRFLEMPTDFHYDEMVKLLAYFGFKETKKGKTSGSRVKFMNLEGVSIMLHKPHPSGILKKYQMKQIKEMLKL
jgi:hypothetical protein